MVILPLYVALVAFLAAILATMLGWHTDEIAVAAAGGAWAALAVVYFTQEADE